MKNFKKVSAALTTAALVLAAVLVVKAATKVVLGSADNFVILAGSTVTNTGSSVITGDLGLHPGTSVTGFPPGTVNGTQHVTNSTALAAKNDLITAYNNAAGQTPNTTVATELGGTTKNAGIYNSSSGTFGITGTLTLDGLGDHNAVFIFKTASTLITAGSSTVALVNGAQACNVFWQVGSSATLGTNSTFKGNILALTSATLTTGANVEGRVLARNGAVTLDTNTISKPACDTSATTTTTTTTTTAAADAATAEAAAAEAAAAAAAAATANGVGGTTATPKLAKAGVAPEQSTNALVYVIPAGLLATLGFVVIRRKRTA
ncbi:MAG: ice-binding family protein [bacterium]|nr:ice-binding family protein [bacterium]